MYTIFALFVGVAVASFPVKFVGQCGNTDAAKPTYAIENEQDWAPFNFKGEGAELYKHVGFAIDIIEAAADYGGCNVEFVGAPWSDCITNTLGQNQGLYPWGVGNGLGYGTFVGCSASNVIPSRTLTHGFTDPFSLSDPTVIAVNPARTGGAIASTDEVTSIAVTKGFAYTADLLQEKFPALYSQICPTPADCATNVNEVPGGAGVGDTILDVTTGNSDAYFGGKATADKNGLTVIAETTGLPVSMIYKLGSDGIGFRDCMNKGIRAIRTTPDPTTPGKTIHQKICEDWITRTTDQLGIAAPGCDQLPPLQ